MNPLDPFSFATIPARIEFRDGAVRQLPEAIETVGQHRAFIVTDRGLMDTPVIPEILAILRDAKMDYDIFADVEPNPTIALMDTAGERLRRYGEAAVIPVGGGSSLDAAKGIALVGANGGSARQYDFSREPDHPAFPVIAVPTTAGTGSETNSWGVIDDPEHRCKVYIGHSSATPRISILDPRLTIGLPPRATAATGIDALVHGIESLTSRRRNPVSDAYAHHAVRLVSRWLPPAVADGKDLEARAGMLVGAHLAGLALTAAGLGLVHGIAHSLSAHTGAVHGEALAAVLDRVMEYNLPAAGTQYAESAVDMGATLDAKDVAAAARAAIEFSRDLADTIGVRRPLSSFGVDAAMVESLAKIALADTVTANNPRSPSHGDLTKLLTAAL